MSHGRSASAVVLHSSGLASFPLLHDWWLPALLPSPLFSTSDLLHTSLRKQSILIFVLWLLIPFVSSSFLLSQRRKVTLLPKASVSTSERSLLCSLLLQEFAPSACPLFPTYQFLVVCSAVSISRPIQSCVTEHLSNSGPRRQWSSHKTIKALSKSYH